LAKLPIIGFYGYWVILTYLGVISAIAGIYFAINGNIKFAVVCLMLSGICDMFDGPVARLAKRNDREKSFGVQIDSLADIVGFGILPAVIGYAIFVNHAPEIYDIFSTIFTVIIISAYVLAALIRLAHFNVVEMELQSKDKNRKYYEGLPVTSVAIIIPVAYLICVNFDFALSQVYNNLLILIAAAFVLKIKIPKLKLRYLVAFCLIGLPIVIYVWLSKGALI
jgi:CDP-diacylglycerol--serine O-phosphatidyltransferase